MTPPTTEQITALEQWAKREHDYATEIGFGTDYTSVNKLRDVLALCAAWREGQEDNLTLQLIIDGVNHDMRCDDGSCLRCQRDAAVARTEQAERERDALLVRVDQWRQMADREATAHVEMRAERDAARQEAAAAQAAWASDVAEWKEWLLGAEQARDGWKQRAEQAEAALTEARRVLREVEHVACKLEGECPYCGQLKERGHEPGCALAAVLAQEEK